MATNAEIGFAGSIIKIGTDVVAKVTSIRVNKSMNEVDTTGAEDTSGSLSKQQFITVSLGETLDMEGVTMDGLGETVAQELEPGQTALRAAADAGTEVTVSHERPNNKGGYDYTGFITSYSEGGQVGDVYRFSASMRVNSKSVIAVV